MKSLDKVQYDSADIPKNNFGSAINEKEHSDKGDKMNEDLEPSGNLENMQLKQQVYEEMKNNNINADHLIEILRVDEKEQSENGPTVEDATNLGEPNSHDDIVS